MLDWLRDHVSWLAPVIVFGLIVFVHELGHFIAAKLCGVYAPRFSIGFGPALLRKRVGETEYVLAALPLGGYVRMASRDDETMSLIEGGGERGAAPGHPGELSEAIGEAAGESPPKDFDPNAMIPFGPKPVPEHRWFESKSIAQRVFILVAGVTMNVLLAYAVNVVLLARYGPREIPTRVVGYVDERLAPPGLSAALHPGDTVTAVAGRPVETWEDVLVGLESAPRDSVLITTSRGTVAAPIGANASPARLNAMRSVEYLRPAVFEALLPNRPAARAGLVAGDSVTAVDGRRIFGFGDLVRALNASAGKPVALDLVRGGAPVRVTVTPAAERDVDPVSGATITVGRIGAVSRQVAAARLDIGAAFAEGGKRTAKQASMVVTSLRDLVTRRASLKQLGGPIAIARSSVAAAEIGASYLWELIAVLSINLAIFNLLPVPVLDGGQILLTVAEAAKGSPFSARVRNAFAVSGLVLVALLFALVMFNDTIRRFL